MAHTPQPLTEYPLSQTAIANYRENLKKEHSVTAIHVNLPACLQKAHWSLSVGRGLTQKPLG